MNEKVKMNDIQKFKTLSVKCYRVHSCNEDSLYKRIPCKFKIKLAKILSEKR